MLSGMMFLFCVFRANEILLQVSSRLEIVNIVEHALINTTNILQNEQEHATALNHQQKTAAFYTMWYRILMSFPALISATMLGAWSDKHGRMALLNTSLVGALLTSGIFSLSFQPAISANWRHAICCILLGAWVYGCSGRSSTFSIGITCLICDYTSDQNRMQNLAKMQGFAFFGTCIGYVCLSVFSKYLDFKWTMLIVGTNLLLQLAFLAFILRTQRLTVIDSNAEHAVKLKYVQDNKGVKLEVCELLQGYISVFKTTERGKIIIMLFCTLIVHFLKIANQDILILFVLREEFGWSGVDYGYLMSIRACSMGIILVFVMPLLEGMFKHSKKRILQVGLLMNSVSLIGMALAPFSTAVFTFGLIGAFGCFTIPSSQSILAQLAREGEMGSVFSLNSLMSSVAQITSPVILTALYTVTVNTFPGMVFLFVGLLQFVAYILVNIMI